MRRSFRLFSTSIKPPPITLDIRMSDFHYHLPENNVAKYPAHPRGSSKLLVIRQQPSGGTKPEHEKFQLSDSVFSSLQESLPMNTHLVFNESRVFSARVYATDMSSTDSSLKPTEILFLNPEAPFQDPSMVETSTNHPLIYTTTTTTLSLTYPLIYNPLSFPTNPLPFSFDLIRLWHYHVQIKSGDVWFENIIVMSEDAFSSRYPAVRMITVVV